MTGKNRDTALDGVSRTIIEQLQEDGRRSYAALGKAAGVSEAAVRQRVQRLLDTGVMKIVAVVEPERVGLTRRAMVGIKTDGAHDGVVDQLIALTEVDRVVVTTGAFDVLAEVSCATDEHLLELVSDSIRAIDGVATTETFVLLETRKPVHPVTPPEISEG